MYIAVLGRFFQHKQAASTVFCKFGVNENRLLMTWAININKYVPVYLYCSPWLELYLVYSSQRGVSTTPSISQLLFFQFYNMKYSIDNVYEQVLIYLCVLVVINVSYQVYTYIHYSIIVSSGVSWRRLYSYSWSILRPPPAIIQCKYWIWWGLSNKARSLRPG